MNVSNMSKICEWKKRQLITINNKFVTQMHNRFSYKTLYSNTCTQGCILFKYSSELSAGEGFQAVTYAWRVKKEGEEKKRRGEGKKKAAWGRENNIFKGAWEGFQQCYALKTFP